MKNEEGIFFSGLYPSRQKTETVSVIPTSRQGLSYLSGLELSYLFTYLGWNYPSCKLVDQSLDVKAKSAD